jgi:hypothetical protein
MCGVVLEDWCLSKSLQSVGVVDALNVSDISFIVRLGRFELEITAEPVACG